MNRAVTSGIVTCALAVGVSVVSPPHTAEALPGGRFLVVNQANGKCLQGHGNKKKVTLATCNKNKVGQQWTNYGATGLANFSHPQGVVCLASAGRNKPVYTNACQGGAGTKWQLASLNNNAKTPIATAHCGFLQSVTTKTVKCNKRTTKNKMTWIIKY